MQPPNLFDFATSELSQDAFICWLASWADPALKEHNESLYKTATAFLDRLLEVAKGPKVSEYRSVRVRRQESDIDVLLLVNDDTAIIIEDKTNTKDHSDQLRRYKEVVAKKLPGHRTAAVYFKTGDQCDYGSAEKAGYGCFLRRDLLRLLKQGEAFGVKNDVFIDFHKYLRGIEEAVQSFPMVPIDAWNRKQWIGLFTALQDRLGDGEWDNRGHGGGGSLTFRWHCRIDKYLVLHGDELGFRIVVTDESQQKTKWNEWVKALLAKDGTGGMKIKPSRSRLGKRMKVASLEGDYRQKNDGGLLDLDGTVEILRKAEALMDAAMASIMKGKP